jgi:hypothetical protein
VRARLVCQRRSGESRKSAINSSMLATANFPRRIGPVVTRPGNNIPLTNMYSSKP